MIDPLHKQESATMKGYSEDRGLSFKLDYDADTKEFVSKPVEHAFAPQVGANVVVQKLAELRKRRQAGKTKRQSLELLAGKNTEARENIGMTEISAAAQRCLSKNESSSI
jgi:hypothetical protein